MIELEPDRLIDTATNTIAADGGFEDFFRYHNCHSAITTSVGGMDQGHRRSADGLALLVNIADATTRMKPVFMRQHI